MYDIWTRYMDTAIGQDTIYITMFGHNAIFIMVIFATKFK